MSQAADFITVGDHRIVLKPNARARRLSLKVDGRSGEAQLVFPRDLPREDAISFALSKRDWLTKKLGAVVAPQPFVDGAMIPYLGEDHRLVHVPGGRGVQLDGQDILIPGEPQFFARRVGDFLKREAGRDMTERSLNKARSIDKRITKITIRDTKSRWGSCSSKGALNYSWRLILTPDWVRDYMAAHEVAHLVHMDHSPRFWAQCEALTELAPVPQSEAFLKSAAKRLFSYGRE